MAAGSTAGEHSGATGAAFTTRVVGDASLAGARRQRPVDLASGALQREAAALAPAGATAAGGKGFDPGELGTPVRVVPPQLAQLIRAQLAIRGNRVVWSRRGAEVVVDLTRTSVEVADGMLGVSLHLESVNAGTGDVSVVLALGGADRETGLLAATPARPFGPDRLVEQWGDSVLAAVWDAVVAVAAALAANAGRDQVGDPLEPAALRATSRGFEVVPQAAHRARPPKA